MRLDRERAALLCVDVQERLLPAMEPGARESVQRYALVLLELARRLDLPVVVTEQYPAGLGPTIPAIAEALAALPRPAQRFDKVDFSACAAPPFAAAWQAAGRDQWIVFGIEAHVCVYQTVRDLIGRNVEVQVPGDAVASRTGANLQTGLRLMERAGAIVTSAETIVFDVLQRAGGDDGDDFRAMSRLIR